MLAEELNRTFFALSDPHRRAIIKQLAHGEATVLELLSPLKISQPSLSKHLKVLEKAGLISRSQVAQTRPCRLEATQLKLVSQWAGMFEALWENSLDKLEEHLNSKTRAGD